MKKMIFTLALAVVSMTVATAQKDVKYSKMYYKNIEKTEGDITITVDNAVSTDGETKFKLKISNKTSDFLILKPEECKFMINGQELIPKEKWLVIKPNESDSKIINMKGTGYNAVKTYSFVVGGLYKTSPKGTVLPAENFKLPAAKNEIKVNDFTCNLVDLNKQTDKTEAKFKCLYTGKMVGFIDPTKTSVKMPDGNEYANAKTTSGILKSAVGPIMFMKGTEETISMGWDRMQGGKAMDMQKVSMDIIWHDAFTEAPLVKLENQTLVLEFDEVTSNAKGK